MLGRGLIVCNGYFDNASTRAQREELKARLLQRGVACDVLRSNAVLALIDGGDIRTQIPEYDFCVFFDKDAILAEMLEKSGLVLFDNARALRICDDKMLTYVTLCGQGIAMPKTIASPLMYSDNDDRVFLDKVEKEIGYPIVVKSVYGSMGREVYLAENRGELDELFIRLRRIPHLYQRFVGARGEDTRIITVGGRAVAAMKRKNPHDFRSNIDRGGCGEPVRPTAAQIALAEKVSRLLKLDYSGIDVIGDATLCEINSNAFFAGIERVTGVDVADLYAAHIVDKIYRGK